MPDLPTLTVTAAQMARITAAFPGASNAEKAEAYKAWLRDAVRGYVKAHEQNALRIKYEADVAAATGTVDADLGAI